MLRPEEIREIALQDREISCSSGVDSWKKLYYSYTRKSFFVVYKLGGMVNVSYVYDLDEVNACEEYESIEAGKLIVEWDGVI